MKDLFDSLFLMVFRFFITVPFAIWKWIDLIALFVKWIGKHWN